MRALIIGAVSRLGECLVDQASTKGTRYQLLFGIPPIMRSHTPISIVQGDTVNARSVDSGFRQGAAAPARKPKLRQKALIFSKETDHVLALNQSDRRLIRTLC